ncbi:AbrB/MazE/SpoVT family DNA-binding domain-containing protein [uncultured Methanobrevibacter sp.]|uniref:AbrB/MazE/SpoVT family DNA-binding domain-containing protein n=1 Tax=uncultured Methanobrevibacter sp. TaxID=253161 RepID=UPI0015BAFAB4|nr:AbrB/MazE/SpoVT family DNA-binding domain-containing protein [uncultured Methanobrevibacter sp.]
MLFANSKLYKNNRTTIPIEVRKKYNLDPKDDVTILWFENDKGEIVVNFKSKSNRMVA